MWSLRQKHRTRFDSPCALLYLAGLCLLIAPPALAQVASSGTSPASVSVTTPIRAGRPAPDFTLPDQSGRVHRLADYQGRAVCLLFVPTLDGAATLQQLQSVADATADFDDTGAKVFVVCPADAAKAKQLHEQEQLPFPLLLDPSGEVSKSYGVTGRRETFVVSPYGKIYDRVRLIDPAHHGKQAFDMAVCCLSSPGAIIGRKVGEAVADFPLSNEGVTGTLYGADKQAATVVLFISARCPCSQSYNGRIRRLAADFAAKNVRIIGVYGNQDETSAQILQHAKAQRFSFPIFRDVDSRLTDYLKARVTPQAFVLDKAGVLRYQGRLDNSRDAESVTSHDLRDAINTVLDGDGVIKASSAFGCAIVRSR